MFYAKRRGDLDASRALVEQQREQHKEDHAQSASSSAAVAAPYKFDFGKCKGLTLDEAESKKPGCLAWCVHVKLVDQLPYGPALKRAMVASGRWETLVEEAAKLQAL